MRVLVGLAVFLALQGPAGAIGFDVTIKGFDKAFNAQAKKSGIKVVIGRVGDCKFDFDSDDVLGMLRTDADPIRRGCVFRLNDAVTITVGDGGPTATRVEVLLDSRGRPVSRRDAAVFVDAMMTILRMAKKIPASQIAEMETDINTTLDQGSNEFSRDLGDYGFRLYRGARGDLLFQLIFRPDLGG